MKTTAVFFGLLYFILLSSANLNAQVTGFVVDQQNNNPIIGATVSVNDGEFGTQTDKNGFFSLNIADFPATLTISFVGYQTKKVSLETADSDLVVQLTPAVFESNHLIVSADRIRISEQETRPVPVTRIKPSDILMTIHASAPEMLRAEPGVYVQQTTIGQGSVYVRGRAGRDVLYIFNHFRINPGFTRSGQNQYFAAIDPFSVDEIRVYRGPVSVFYGSDALSGGVHVKPDIPSFSDSTETNGSVLFQTNIHGTGERTGSANVKHRQNRFSLSLTGTLRDFNYYRMPGKTDDERWFPYGRKLNLAEMNFGALSGSARLRLNNGGNISLVSYYSKIPDSPRLDRMMLGYDIENDLIPGEPRSGYFSNTAPLRFKAHHISLQLRGVSSLFSTIQLRGGFHRLNDDRVERPFADSPFFSQNPDEIDYTFTISDTAERDRNQSDQWLLSADLITPVNEQITLNWGGDFTYEIINSSLSLNGEPSGLPRYPDGTEILSSGLFLHADHHFSRNFLAEYGIRHSYTQNRLAFEGAGTNRGFDSMKQSFSQLTAAAGARYTINRNIDITGNVSTGFRAPNIADLAEIGIRRSDQYQSPNSDLDPEKSVNVDTGLHFHSDRLSFELHGFWLHYFDKVERVFTGSIVDRDGRLLRQGTTAENVEEFVEVKSANAGKMNLLGVELGAEILLTPSVKAGTNFNYIWGELILNNDETEPVDRIPPANGLIYLDVETISNLKMRPQARYNFAHRRISPLEIGDNRISRNGTDGFINLQFIAMYEGIPYLELKVFADNLLNRSYREHASSLDGLARNVTVSLSYSF